jgi:hypothetical protein
MGIFGFVSPRLSILARYRPKLRKIGIEYALTRAPSALLLLGAGGRKMQMKLRNLFVIALLAQFSLWACGPDLDSMLGSGGQLEEKDSGWIGADSYEVGAIVSGIVIQSRTGDFSEVDTDPDQQIKLIDKQIKFIKTTAEKNGWRFNQLVDTVRVVNVVEDGDQIQIEYEAVVDMLGRLRGSSVPSLNELEAQLFQATVPMSPTRFTFQEMRNCSEVDGGHFVADYNFHYYFAPEKAECELELTEVAVQVTEVFPRKRTYPEYDRLLQALEGGGTGFKAALVPNRGDNDPMSRFQAHADMLEQELDLMGTDYPEGFRQYVWEQGQATIIIDLYDPTQAPGGQFADGFRARLGEYTLVHYNGHSSYGSKHLLDEPEAFSDAYQILMIHSCQSYAYYTRQAFRAKATLSDPSGFDLADIIATGKSSYPGGSPPTLRVLLSSLMDSMEAILEGEPEGAVDWITIAEKMSASTWGDILYGIAGVRTNTWSPNAR